MLVTRGVLDCMVCVVRRVWSASEQQCAVRTVLAVSAAAAARHSAASSTDIVTSHTHTHTCMCTYVLSALACVVYSSCSSDGLSVVSCRRPPVSAVYLYV